MEALVLDTNFIAVGILDTYTSFIWTDRFASCGDFEIYTTANRKTMDLLRTDYYLWRKETNHVMIIDEIKIDTDTEEGSTLTVCGESLEAILKRRIIWTQTSINDTLQNGIKKLLDDNIINPVDENRKIPNFIFEENTDERLTEMKLEAQFTGDNLYDVVCDLCDTYDIGFQVTLNDLNQFVFKLVLGEDRSYAQDKNTYVVFSPEWDNVVNSNYLESTRAVKNVVLVAGEGEYPNRKQTSIGVVAGLERRELFVDARGISSEREDNSSMTDAEYTSALNQKGDEELAAHKKTHIYDGEMNADQMFIFGKDFFIGDTVQLKDDYGNESSAQIIEMIYSRNKSGFSYYPTFNILGNEEGK